MFDIRAHDRTASAPGELELVQRFMNLHEHGPGGTGDLPPSRALFEEFLRRRGLLDEGTPFTEADRDAALELHRALHAKVRASGRADLMEDDVEAIDRTARRAGLRPRFGRGGPDLVPSQEGVPGALGRIVAVAFLADLQGAWEGLKECAGDDCNAVFFDRSKNHSGRWCSMSTCGNRAKVRAWRERRRADDPV
jgi:predicted RNA-binding Zn ribbon-like protein